MVIINTPKKLNTAAIIIAALGVIALVEGDGLDVHLGIQQLRALGPDAEGVVYVGLGPDGGVNPEVFDAVFVIRLTVL